MNRAKQNRHRSPPPLAKSNGGSAARPAIDPRKSWLYPHLLVRVLSKGVQRGAAYRKKGIIQDVVAPGLCTLQLEDGALLDGKRRKDVFVGVFY